MLGTLVALFLVSESAAAKLKMDEDICGDEDNYKCECVPSGDEDRSLLVDRVLLANVKSPIYTGTLISDRKARNFGRPL